MKATTARPGGLISFPPTSSSTPGTPSPRAAAATSRTRHTRCGARTRCPSSGSRAIVGYRAHEGAQPRKRISRRSKSRVHGVPGQHWEAQARLVRSLGAGPRRASEGTQAQDAGAALGRGLSEHFERKQRARGDCPQSALRGWNPFRCLAQGGTIVLVPGEKRRRIRSRTTLRPFRNHDVEREHEVERMAAGVPNSPANAANSQRARAALISTHFLPTHGAAAERLVFRGDAMHIVKCRT